MRLISILLLRKASNSCASHRGSGPESDMSDGFVRAQARMAALGAPKLAAWAGGARDDAPASTSVPSTASPAKLRPNVAFLGNTLRAITSANARLDGARRKADPGTGVGKTEEEAKAERVRGADERRKKAERKRATAPTLAATGEFSGTDDDNVDNGGGGGSGAAVGQSKSKRRIRTRGGAKRKKRKKS